MCNLTLSQEAKTRAAALMAEAKRLGGKSYYIAALRKIEEAEAEFRLADRLAAIEGGRR